MRVTLKPELANTERHVAVVIGVFVNGLHAVRALGQGNVPIIALDYEDNVGLHSKYVSQRVVVNYYNDDRLFVDVLQEMGQQLKKKAVLFPTHDHHTKIFAEYYAELEPYYYIPVNKDNLLNIISKEYQYTVCAESGVPFPKTFFVRSMADLEKMLVAAKEMMYPLILKPLTRASNSGAGGNFRVKELGSYEELRGMENFLEENLKMGFLVSEIVPGEPDNIWAYTGYSNQAAQVLAGWTGRKLTQRPYYFGVFSSAMSEKNPVVEEQGIKLLEALKHVGIGEPEFKYDARDGQYKLMEVNPRLMMWHGVGHHAGVNLPLLQYYDLTGDQAAFQAENKKQYPEPRHIVFMAHELLNILDHSPKEKFIKNAWRSFWLPRKVWGIWAWNDPNPYANLFIWMFKRFWNRIRGKS